jgi:hypothetical protein
MVFRVCGRNGDRGDGKLSAAFNKARISSSLKM